MSWCQTQCDESNLCSEGQIRCQICTHDTTSATHDQLAPLFIYHPLLNHLLKNLTSVHECRLIFATTHLVLQEDVPDVFYNPRRGQNVVTTFLVAPSVDAIVERIPIIPDRSESAWGESV